MDPKSTTLITKIRNTTLSQAEKDRIISSLQSNKVNENGSNTLTEVMTESATDDLLNRSILDLRQKQEELAAANEELERQKAEIQVKNEELTKQKGIVESQRRSLENNLKDLENSYSQLEQFSYVASHDLKSPLRTISNFASLLRKRYKGKFDAEADEFLDFIVTGALNMNQVICDLLDYSRLGLKENDFSVVNLQNIIDLVSFNLNDEINSNQVNLICDPMPTLQANKSSMIQLFQNLISNAIKFRQQSITPEIIIKVEDCQETWKFTLQDNGVGMDEQFQTKAFQPFQRLNNQERPGTGMGLAICKKVVGLHGGDIQFNSKLNEGTCFTFSLRKQGNSIEQRKAHMLSSN